MATQQTERNQSIDPSNRPQTIHSVIPNAGSQTQTKSSTTATSPPKKLRFSELPLEIRQMIFNNTITPFQRLEAPLGYILDPNVHGDFCYQRETFKAELDQLRKLPSSTTGGTKWLNLVEKKWREEWETCMLEMIEEDRKFWKGKSVNFHNVLHHQDVVVIDDVFETTKQVLERQSDSIRDLIRQFNLLSNSDSRETNKDFCKQIAMLFIMKTYRRETIRRINEEIREKDGEEKTVLIRKQYEMEKRHVLIREVEEKVGGIGMGRTLGLRGFLSWNFQTKLSF